MRTERSDRSADAAAGQVSRAAAEVYEQFLVPALFGQWVGPMLDAVSHVGGLTPGLDLRRGMAEYLPTCRQRSGRTEKR